MQVPPCSATSDSEPQAEPEAERDFNVMFDPVRGSGFQCRRRCPGASAAAVAGRHLRPGHSA